MASGGIPPGDLSASLFGRCVRGGRPGTPFATNGWAAQELVDHRSTKTQVLVTLPTTVAPSGFEWTNYPNTRLVACAKLLSLTGKQVRTKTFDRALRHPSSAMITPGAALRHGSYDRPSTPPLGPCQNQARQVGRRCRSRSTSRGDQAQLYNTRDPRRAEDAGELVPKLAEARSRSGVAIRDRVEHARHARARRQGARQPAATADVGRNPDDGSRCCRIPTADATNPAMGPSSVDVS